METKRMKDKRKLWDKSSVIETKRTKIGSSFKDMRNNGIPQSNQKIP
jgi:hypothetical protein